MGVHNACKPDCGRIKEHAAPECCLREEPEEGRFVAVCNGDTVERFVQRKLNEELKIGKLHRMAALEDPMHNDPTRAPSHYLARFRRNGIEPGAELLDWIAATRGASAAIDFLRVEILTKAQRLGLRGESDAERLANEMADLFKIEQATAKLRGFLEHVQDAVPHGKDCES